MKKIDEKNGLVLEVLDDLIAECSRRQENPIALPKVYWDGRQDGLCHAKAMVEQILKEPE